MYTTLFLKLLNWNFTSILYYSEAFVKFTFSSEIFCPCHPQNAFLAMNYYLLQLRHFFSYLSSTFWSFWSTLLFLDTLCCIIFITMLWKDRICHYLFKLHTAYWLKQLNFVSRDPVAVSSVSIIQEGKIILV